MRFASLQSDLAKTVLSGSVLLSFVVGFLCISFINAMPAHAAMDMGAMHNYGEYALSVSDCCDAGANDHMELWKSTFVGIPQSPHDLLVLFAFATTAGLTLPSFLVNPRLTGGILSFRYRQYAREHPDILTYNPLRLAFARGILHPKTF